MNIHSIIIVRMLKESNVPKNGHLRCPVLFRVHEYLQSKTARFIVSTSSIECIYKQSKNTRLSRYFGGVIQPLQKADSALDISKALSDVLKRPQSRYEIQQKYRLD